MRTTKAQSVQRLCHSPLESIIAIGPMFKHLPRNPASDNAMKQTWDPASDNAMKPTCVIAILAYFTLFQPICAKIAAKT